MSRLATLVAALAVAVAPTAAHADEDASDLSSAMRDVRRALSGGAGEAWWEVGGRIAVDLVRRGAHRTRRDAVHVDEARIDLRFGRGPWFGLVEVDAEGSDSPSNLREAWVGLSFGPRLVLRVGQVRQAMNSELASPPSMRSTPGLGFVSQVTGRTAPGIAAESEWNCGGIRWEVSATAGRGHDVTGATRRGDRFVARGIVRPLQNVLPQGVAREIGDGLWVALAASRERRLEGPIRIEAPSEAAVLRTTGDLSADHGAAWVGEIGWAWDRVRVSGERTVGDMQDVRTRRGTRDVDRMTAWALHATVCLTDAQPEFDHGRWTRGSTSTGSRGDWEVAVRYAALDLDRELIGAGLARPGGSSERARTFTAALGWRPTRELRVMLAYERTTADSPLASFGGERTDHALLLRLEVAF